MTLLNTPSVYAALMEDHKRRGQFTAMRAILDAVKRRVAARAYGTEADRRHWLDVWAAIAAYEGVVDEHESTAGRAVR